MDTVKVVAIMAGTASFAAGVISVILRRVQYSPKIKETPRDSRRAEFRATTKAVRSSLDLSRAGVRRLKLLFIIAVSYIILNLLLVFTASYADGLKERILYVTSLVFGIGAGGLLLSVVLMGYRSIRERQDSIEDKLNEVSKLVHR